MEVWRFLKWLYGEISGDLGVYEHCVCMGECCAHSPCLSISSDYFILVERNPMDKCQRDRWERDWDAGRVPKTVLSASKFHLSLVLTQF